MNHHHVGSFPTHWQLLTLDNTGRAMAPEKKKHTRLPFFFMLFKTPFSWNFAGRFFTPVRKTPKRTHIKKEPNAKHTMKIDINKL